MSQIIVISLYGLNCREEAISAIRDVSHKYGRGVQFEIPDYEPWIRDYPCPDLMFTLSDSDATINCEWLLLPDGWWYNDKTNPEPFYQRMKILQQLADQLRTMCRRMEILVGESGLDLDCFSIHQVDAKDVPEVMVREFVGIYDCYPIRLIIQ